MTGDEFIATVQRACVDLDGIAAVAENLMDRVASRDIAEDVLDALAVPLEAFRVDVLGDLETLKAAVDAIDL